MDIVGIDAVKPRTSFRFDRIDAATLAAYSALLGWTIAHHEQWFDESQAWLIARDSSLADMLTHPLRSIFAEDVQLHAMSRHRDHLRF